MMPIDFLTLIVVALSHYRLTAINCPQRRRRRRQLLDTGQRATGAISFRWIVKAKAKAVGQTRGAVVICIGKLPTSSPGCSY